MKTDQTAFWLILALQVLVLVGGSILFAVYGDDRVVPEAAVVSEFGAGAKAAVSP